ncbi:diacylglycerol kinase family protein [Actinoplanes oblitus]|uniref:Diacylglycerol kinase family protein n=1 Tax=Actinoplanes oblitus TaxID=3040509 RepID=A0ABY8WKK2_9ACTN|nr:diacylglycerol kinase family protein [Actinoplanes oblitus]WIM98426.1 diacylglycerol kinase family protein [Actinoplanes oblitus]
MIDNRARRWLARLAFVAAVAATVLVLAVAGLRGSLALLLIGAIGSAVTLAAAWVFLTHRRLLRWAAGLVVVLTPVVVAVLFARAQLIWVVLVFGLLWAGAMTAGRRALAVEPDGPAVRHTPAPHRPFLIMNPRSGGGKVGRFRLDERARELGAEVFLLDGPAVDVAEVARQAVRDGADLLGVAGGDGTQALVAGVAAEHGIPFLVISAGTRNHFALDLGLDRENPAACLDALTDGEEVRIDLGRIGDRTFVNNASFGAYATVVQSPEYRDAKIGTALDLLPSALNGASPLELTVDGITVSGPQAVLISNNAYRTDSGQRAAMDRGELGVLAVTVRGALDAAGLIGWRGRARSLTVRTAHEAIVDAEPAEVPVGVDGEALMLATPVRCEIRPGALRVRLPRRRPGVPVPPPHLDWTRLRRLAFASRR